MKGIAAIAILVFFLAFAFPSPAHALSLFSPFGGKVKSYDPAPSACLTEITIPILIATFFTTLVTIEQIEVGDPVPATLGLLRVQLIPIPNPNAVKRNFAYFVPGNKVLGNSIDLCGICQKVAAGGQALGGDIAKAAEKICKSIPVIGEFLDTICEAVTSSGCPVGNLVYQIGSGSPIGTAIEGGVSKAVSTVCNTIAGSIPLVGSLLKKLCPK